MKALNLIILALAVTLFVACSKKKDGNNGQYQGQNPYGLTPNDIYTGYNTGGVYPPNTMPGYQLPQGSCGGPAQMFSDLVSYCGWLARDGERACNPMAVRQNFLQYCQSFSVRFNYCQQEVRTGCYYGGGCNYGSGRTIRYTDHQRDHSLGDDYHSPGDGNDYIPPVVVNPPHNVCQPNPGKDCKKKNPKKSELICKLPSDDYSESNYVYSYEEYMDIAKTKCSSRGATVQQTEVHSATVYRNEVQSQPVQQVVAQNTRVENRVQESEHVVAAPVSNESCITLESKPATDCRLKRADFTSVARGTTRKQLREFDFEKDSSGKIPFMREVEKGNIECRPALTSANYELTYSDYLNSLQSCKIETQNVATTQEIHESGHVTSATVQAKAEVSSCLNLETLQKNVLDPNNHLSSWSLYSDKDSAPFTKNLSKAYYTQWANKIKANDSSNYRGSVNGESNGNLTGLGSGVRQTSSQLTIDGQTGRIIDCNQNLIHAKIGNDDFTISSNNIDDYDDLIITITRQGKFSYKNESSGFITTRYVGFGKNLNRQGVKKEVEKDLRRLGLDTDPFNQ